MGAGPELSALGLGCNNFGPRLDANQSEAVVAASLDVGINHFDTADIYGDGLSEQYLGRAIRGKRADVVISTKVGIRRDALVGGGSREHVARSCDASLRRLGTDYIDVYYLHRPDPGTPICETLGAFKELVEAGKVRHIACSNHEPWQVTDMWNLAELGERPPMAGIQVELNVLQRTAEDALLPACESLGIGAVVYSPLASGLLTGKYSSGAEFPEGSRMRVMPQFAGIATPINMRIAEGMRELAAECGTRPSALALSWALSRPSVTAVLAGATSPEQVRQNAEDVAFKLEPVHVTRMEEITTAATQENCSER